MSTHDDLDTRMHPANRPPSPPKLQWLPQITQDSSQVLKAAALVCDSALRGGCLESSTRGAVKHGNSLRDRIKATSVMRPDPMAMVFQFRQREVIRPKLYEPLHMKVLYRTTNAWRTNLFSNFCFNSIPGALMFGRPQNFECFVIQTRSRVLLAL